MLNPKNIIVNEWAAEELVAAFRQHGAEIPQAVDAVIISALDRSADDSIAQDRFVEQKDLVLAGIAAIHRLVQPATLIFAIPRELKHVISDGDECSARVVVVRSVYPNGLPEVLAQRCGLADKKCAYIDTNRLASLMASIADGTPATNMNIAVGGTGIEKRTVSIAVGSTVGSVLADLEIAVDAGDKVLLGGLMRGEACSSLDQVIPADTDSLFVQKAKAVLHFSMHSCLNCGKCVDVCPVHLQAAQLSKYAEYSLFGNCRDLTPQACVQCGLCSYVCIAGRPVSQLVHLAVQNIDSSADDAGQACDGGKTCPMNKPCC